MTDKCSCCKISSRSDDSTPCGGCDAYLCAKCSSDDTTFIFTWVSVGESIMDMISEDEAFQNEELLCKALEDGKFYCPRCSKTV